MTLFWWWSSGCGNKQFILNFGPVPCTPRIAHHLRDLCIFHWDISVRGLHENSTNVLDQGKSVAHFLFKQFTRNIPEIVLQLFKCQNFCS